MALQLPLNKAVLMQSTMPSCFNTGEAILSSKLISLKHCYLKVSVVKRPDIQTPKTSAGERRYGPQVCCLIYNWAARHEWMGACFGCSYIENAGRWQSISQQGRWKKKWEKKSETFSQKTIGGINRQWYEDCKYVVLSILWDGIVTMNPCPQINDSEYCSSLFSLLNSVVQKKLPLHLLCKDVLVID